MLRSPNPGTMHLRDSMDMQAKRREWRLERLGWAIIALVIVLGMAGVFGEGPLAKRRAESTQAGAAFAADYERLNRMDHVSLLVVHVEAPGATGDELNLSFDPGTSSAWTIRSSSPSADGALDGNGIVYSFPVEDWSRPISIGFEYVPESFGPLTTTLTITAGDLPPATLTLDQFVYP